MANLRIRVLREMEVIGSCEIEYGGGNAHLFRLKINGEERPYAFRYDWVFLDSENNIIGVALFSFEPDKLISTRIELMLQLGDLEHPETLPGWQKSASRPAISIDHTFR